MTVFRRLSMVVAACLVVTACTGAETAPSTTALPSTTTTVDTTTAPTTSTVNVATTLPAVTTTEVSTSTTVALDPLQGLRLDRLTDGLAQPTAIAVAPGGDEIYVTERTGQIRIIGADGLDDEPFLDLSGRVQSGGIEQGLLGLAFHPAFPDNRRLYVTYVTGEGHRRVAEFTVGGDTADTERVLIDLAQPEASVDIRHYAGHLAFGPEGHLFVAFGDGADARGQGQDSSTLYGTILRIDVDTGDPYAIPPGNPFSDGDGGAPEVWAYGLRNPWRFDIDPVGGQLYVADVGQEDIEEVDVLPLDDGGHNLGWAAMEGTSCFFERDCDPSRYVLPVIEYRHDEGCSITGGVVYRGDDIPELDGHYFYGDWCGQWVRSFRYSDDTVEDETDWSDDLDDVGQVTAFGTDADGETLVTNFAGELFRIEPIRGT